MNVENNRFEVRSMKGVKVQYIENGRVRGWFEPIGWGCFDTKREEFIIFTEDSEYDCYTRKATMIDVVSQFNLLGATCGNDNLKLIKRYENR